MPDLIGSVASLTGYHDRDLLASTLVEVLADWLQPAGLCMYRCVGEPDQMRLMLQAGVERGGLRARGDPPWTPLEALPAVADWPVHRQALANGHPVLGRRAGSGGALTSVFPLTLDTERHGLIEVRSDQALSVEQQGLVAGVLKIYRNQIGLLDYSERDTLTGLLNRKTFDEQFNKCLLEDTACPPSTPSAAPVHDERRREGSAMRYWIGVIDIDHFKRVNDNFGHLIGDEVLLLVARLLRTALRQGDLLYRFGGEEFVVLLRADGRAAAAVAFERLREQMQSHRFPQVGGVTISLGFSALRVHDTASAAFERADQAVYYAKQHGRNQVRCHEALIESGGLEVNDKVGAIELF